ncbi:MAG: DUF308 domain-containing protein [Schleiferiaceae bacterium]|nr:DUF308 domain-containing protein [Schleiferiaceae bacterium]
MEKSKVTKYLFYLLGIAAMLLGLSYFANHDFDNAVFIRQTGWLIILVGAGYGIFYLIRHKDALMAGQQKYLFALIAILIGVLINYFSTTLASVVNLLLAGYAIWLGILQFLSALQQEGKNYFLWATGTLSIILGVLILWNPFDNLKIGYIIGIYALILGSWLLYKGYKKA